MGLEVKWITKDIEMFLGAKEYVDTVILPLIEISFTEGIKQSASNCEYINILSQQIEKQFKGRVILLPAVTYGSEWKEEDKQRLIQEWSITLEKEKFPFIFFLTSDVYWKSEQKVSRNDVLWSPSIPFEYLEEKYKQPMMEEQVKSIVNSIIEKWRNEQN